MKTELELQRELTLIRAMKFFRFYRDKSGAQQLKNMIFAWWLDVHASGCFEKLTVGPDGFSAPTIERDCTSFRLN